MTDLIAEYIEWLEFEDRAESTRDLYAYLLRRMDCELPYGLTRANTDELKAWIFTTGRGPTTLALYRAVPASFFRWATRPADPRLSLDPTALLPRVHVPEPQERAITVDAFRDIVARAPMPYRLWYLVAGLMGARCVEIAALDTGHLADRTPLHGKGGRTRWVPTPETVRELALELAPGPVAREADGSPMDRQRLSKVGAREMRRLGHDVTMHQLRHTYGTACYEEDHDLVAVQKLLGHASVTTTQRYVARPEQAMRKAANGAAGRLLAA